MDDRQRVQHHVGTVRIDLGGELLAVGEQVGVTQHDAWAGLRSRYDFTLNGSFAFMGEEEPVELALERLREVMRDGRWVAVASYTSKIEPTAAQ